jgi:hypothetical protein
MRVIGLTHYYDIISTESVESQKIGQRRMNKINDSSWHPQLGTYPFEPILCHYYYLLHLDPSAHMVW